MNGIFLNFYNFIMDAISALGVCGPLLGSLLIVLESIIPPLPLFVFITINFLAFGSIIGFIISWACTIAGCMLSYYLVKKFLRDYILKKIKNVELLQKCINYVKNLSITKVTVILSIPFTPAFMINIAAGIANIDARKYFISLLISKIFLIYFWGVVGTSLVESLKNPTHLITILIMLLSAYILSLIVKKIFNLD